jgi:preprotein translocase SecE subunit
MADENASKRPAKRRLKNPETVREKALKAQEIPDKPSRVSSARSKTASVARVPFRGVRKVFSYPPFRWLRKPLRLLGKVLFVSYFVNSWRELRQVTWPTGKKTRQLVFAVLIFAVVFGAVVSVVDYGLDKVFREVLLK